MAFVDILGFVAGTLTTLSILPQVLKTFKLKETHELSIAWLLMLVSGTFLWSVYGYMISSPPVLVANIISCLLVLILFFLKLKYK